MGLKGVVTDGGYRDSAVIGKLDIPAYHHRPSSPTNLTLHQALDLNVPIGCGEVAVFPGDIMVGDADSVICIPAAIADEIADEATQMTEFEDFVIDQVKAGKAIIGLYPATKDETLADFEQWKKNRAK